MDMREINSLVCFICNEKFDFVYLYYIHMKNHFTKPGSYDCDMCSESFPSKKIRYQHIFFEHIQDGEGKIAVKGNRAEAFVQLSPDRSPDHDLPTQPSGSGSPESLYIVEPSKPVDNRSPGSLHLVELSTVSSIDDSSSSAQPIADTSYNFNALHRSLNEEDVNNSPAKQKKKAISTKLKIPSLNICCFCNKSYKIRKSLYSHIRRSHTLKHGTNQSFLEENISNLNKTDEKSSESFSVIKNSLSLEKLLIENITEADCKSGYSPNNPENNTQSLNIDKKTKIKEAKFKKKNFQCTICESTFENSTELVAHRRLENHNITFECFDCGRLFTNKGKLAKHQTMVHLKLKPYKCGYCNKSFGMRETLRNHLKSHTNEKPFTCPLPSCGKTFRRKSNLRLHSVIHTGKKEYICSHCGKQFYHKHDMRYHEIRCSSEEYQTQRAVKEIANKTLRLLTEDEILQTTKSPFKSKSTFVCSICGKNLTSIYNLQAHERNHLGIKPYTCEVCGKSFSNVYYLQKHKSSHDQVRPNKIKKYACNLCEKTFADKVHSKRHEQSHRGIKPYSCRFCGKRFTQKGHSNEHEKIHLGIKNFKCSFCDKKFRLKGNLQEHEITVHSSVVDKVTCNICQRSFPHKYAFFRHRRIHKEPALKT